MLIQPSYKDFIWGGNHIQKQYGRNISFDRCAESWELSDREEGCSIILNGEYKGFTLKELLLLSPVELIGRDTSKLPLLIKILDATQNLSVQVHPDHKLAKTLGGEAKTEMWVILNAKPGSTLYLGLSSKLTKEEFLKSIVDNEVESHLFKIHPKVGEVYLIPAGHVHAVGQGCLIYEIGENSNTTYRIYDWNRKGSDGNPRELHIQQALEAVHLHQPFHYMQEPVIEYEGKDGMIETLVQCEYFHVKRITTVETTIIQKETDSFHFLFLEDGNARVIIDDQLVHLNKGESCFIPAICDEYFIQPLSKITLYQTSLE